LHEHKDAKIKSIETEWSRRRQLQLSRERW